MISPPVTQALAENLDLFSLATNWKKYIFKQIAGYLGEKTLEVGVGQGSNLPYLGQIPSIKELRGIEIDPHLYQKIPSPWKNAVSLGAIDSLQDNSFDSLVYLDVIEHIQNDVKEISTACQKLKNRGHLICLVPAHPFLFTAFDEKIGHYRRYNRKSLHQIFPNSGGQIILSRYLDSLGLFASLANKLFLHQSYPNRSQILFWDRFLVYPGAIFFDSLLNYHLGKSLLVIWKKDEN